MRTPTRVYRIAALGTALLLLAAAVWAYAALPPGVGVHRHDAAWSFSNPAGLLLVSAAATIVNVVLAARSEAAARGTLLLGGAHVLATALVAVLLLAGFRALSVYEGSAAGFDLEANRAEAARLDRMLELLVVAPALLAAVQASFAAGALVLFYTRRRGP